MLAKSSVNSPKKFKVEAVDSRFLLLLEEKTSQVSKR
jgi:hypothetical protein